MTPKKRGEVVERMLKMLHVLRKSMKGKNPTTITINCDSFETATTVMSTVRDWPGVIDTTTVMTGKIPRKEK